MNYMSLLCHRRRAEMCLHHWPTVCVCGRLWLEVDRRLSEAGQILLEMSEVRTAM